ncbi:MAG: rubrerythrin family protein [Promethearchaeota archaeon]
MYPKFIEEAKSDGNKAAERSFSIANEVEKIHHDLYKKALDAVDKGQDLPNKEMYVCPVCGYTHEGPLEEDCPICGAKKETFIKIE